MEVMLATAVLALGTVFIFRAFFVSINAYDYYQGYLKTASWMNEKLWEADEFLSSTQSLNSPTSGTFLIAGEPFQWDIASSIIQEKKKVFKLYRIDLVVSWRNSARSMHCARSAYALYSE